jgi:hypothetical protein
MAADFGSSERMGYNRRPFKGNPKARAESAFFDENRGLSEEFLHWIRCKGHRRRESGDLNGLFGRSAAQGGYP